MRILILSAAIVIAASISFADEMYTWTDSDGSMHFVDDPSKIPDRAQKRAQKRASINKPTLPDRTFSKTELNSIYESCKARISEILKAPSTAKYQPYSQSVPVVKHNGNYFMQVAADAQNSYGAMMRNTYFCTIDPENMIAIDVKY